jgi:hypothetical protein
MALAQSKLPLRDRFPFRWKCDELGIGPGSVLEWEEEGDSVVVRKAGRCTSEDIHRAIFPQETPASKKVEVFDKGVRRYMKKQARR